MNVILTYTFATEHGDTVTDERKRKAGNQVLELSNVKAKVKSTYHVTAGLLPLLVHPSRRNSLPVNSQRLMLIFFIVLP